ncbi:MAG TPA: sulfite oxidase [Chloroflexia bacterium]|nr:sulfite oxidase [Chloroflexia bacterium]
MIAKHGNDSHAVVKDQAGLVVVKHKPLNAEAPLGALREAVTPLQHFYLRSNFDVPLLDPDSWRLHIGGAVERPADLSLAELRSHSTHTITATMECAGNSRTGLAPLPTGEPWGSGAVSTAIWRGVSLRSVLERTGLRPTAVEVVFTAADRGTMDGNSEVLPFARSLPIEKALHPDTILVYEMNGVPLPPGHGGPVRLFVPGWYGMASVKWLVRIEAVEQPFTGFFQAQRYILDLPGSITNEPLREMRVKSIITSPAPGALLARGLQTISGVAWSGGGPIKTVEVSVEGGGAWQQAQLVGDGTPYGWQRWQYEWVVTRPGRHVLRARATDEQGNVQPDVAAWNRLGYANNSIQPVIVQVQEQDTAG